MTKQPAAALLRRIQHDAGEPELVRAPDQREIRLPVGEHHRDDAAAASGRLGERRQAAVAIAAGEQPNLDDVDAERGGARHRRGDALRHHRQIADRGADAAPPSDMLDHGADRRRRQGAERPG